MDPSLFRYMDTSAHMDLDGGITRGGCVIELRPQGWPRKEEVNAKVATWVDRPRFTRLLLDLCASYTNPQKGAGHESLAAYRLPHRHPGSARAPAGQPGERCRNPCPDRLL